MKIILIEDDSFINDLYVHVLEKAGYTVIPALDGLKGIEICKSNADAALILLDIMLPKMHGLDVLKQLKLDTGLKEIPVVMMTNLGEEAIVKSTLEAGARDYIKKVHITPKQLVEAVNGYLSDPNFSFSVNTV